MTDSWLRNSYILVKGAITQCVLKSQTWMTNLKIAYDKLRNDIGKNTKWIVHTKNWGIEVPQQRHCHPIIIILIIVIINYVRLWLT